MLLKFAAREGLVREPDCVPAIGQAARFLGRSFEPSRKEIVNGKQVTLPASHPANAGFECDSDSDIARVATKNAKKGAFWPLDKATAEHCGMPFVEVELNAGVWDAKPKGSFTGSKTSKAAE
jgi:hypothetical protein